MRHRHCSAAILLIGTLGLAACSVAGPPARTVAAGAASDGHTSDGPTSDEPTAVETPADAAGTGDLGTAPASGPQTTGSTPKKSKSKPKTSTGPRIVSFRVVQKPKCAEGTAVFRADPVSLIIEWKLAGATGGALSVDDNTHTPGTYGEVGLHGREEFRFTCAGKVGTTETHSYAIYTVGGGTQKSKTIHVSAKVLDKGIGNG